MGPVEGQTSPAHNPLAKGGHSFTVRVAVFTSGPTGAAILSAIPPRLRKVPMDEQARVRACVGFEEPDANRWSAQLQQLLRDQLFEFHNEAVNLAQTSSAAQGAYDLLACALEDGLRRRYSAWSWDVARYTQIVPAEILSGMPAWVRFRAHLLHPSSVTASYCRRWMLCGKPVADLVVAIGEQMEFERFLVMHHLGADGAAQRPP